LARSTLLHALQNERNNVQELETMISTLQQNNSAIADMVLSRDSLIEELNNRVGVFEDDKMVLKAALRQLQNEIKEEAPKTELLIQELDQARSGMYGSVKSLSEVLLIGSHSCVTPISGRSTVFRV
jgi:predicted  nucleic acid-binding Zn-ribbon protein